MMEKAFEHLLASCRDMTEEEQSAETDWFGRKVTATAAMGFAARDMHEHRCIRPCGVPPPRNSVAIPRRRS